MVTNVVSDIGGVGVFGAISITLFFAVFTGALIRAWCVKRTVAQQLAAMPLDDGETQSSEGLTHE